MMTPQRNDQSSMAAQPNRRRQYIVHPKVQWKHALTLGAAVFLFCVILSCGLFATLHEEARRRVINPAGYSGSVFTVIISAALVYSALTAGVIIFWMIVTTHRLCGPVYVLEQYLQKIANGEMPELRPLRNKDEFKDVFETFTRAVHRVREDKEFQMAGISNALALARARYTCEQEYREALESVVAKLAELRSALSDDLGHPAFAGPAEAAKPMRPLRVPAGTV
jgi:hypothetical protein